MKNKMIVYGSVVLGIVFFAVAFVYLTHGAGTLPSYFPGYQIGSTVVHIKHGIGSFLLGLGALVVAWFASGKN